MIMTVSWSIGGSLRSLRKDFVICIGSCLAIFFFFTLLLSVGHSSRNLHIAPISRHTALFAYSKQDISRRGGKNASKGRIFLFRLFAPPNKIKKPLSKDKDFFMEHRGIEPLTSRLRTLRSPS